MTAVHASGVFTNFDVFWKENGASVYFHPLTMYNVVTYFHVLQWVRPVVF